MIQPGCRCRYVSLAELEAAIHDASRWLSTHEQVECSKFRSPERRISWIAGRMLAKQLILESLPTISPSPTKITITSRGSHGLGTRPRVLLQGKTLQGSLSISHSQRGVAAVWSQQPNQCVGVDLAEEQQTSAGFRRLWLTEAERQFGRRRDLTPLAAWVAKEAVFKACNRGESFAPRQLEIRPTANGQLTGSFFGTDLAGALSVQLWKVDGQIGALARFDNCGHLLSGRSPDVHLPRQRMTT